MTFKKRKNDPQGVLLGEYLRKRKRKHLGREFMETFADASAVILAVGLWIMFFFYFMK